MFNDVWSISLHFLNKRCVDVSSPCFLRKRAPDCDPQIVLICWTTFGPTRCGEKRPGDRGPPSVLFKVERKSNKLREISSLLFTEHIGSFTVQILTRLAYLCLHYEWLNFPVNDNRVVENALMNTSQEHCTGKQGFMSLGCTNIVVLLPQIVLSPCRLCMRGIRKSVCLFVVDQTLT